MNRCIKRYTKSSNIHKHSVYKYLGNSTKLNILIYFVLKHNLTYFQWQCVCYIFSHWVVSATFGRLVYSILLAASHCIGCRMRLPTGLKEPIIRQITSNVSSSQFNLKQKNSVK